jgi:integrase
MKAQPTSGGFEKVGECLYRYSSTGGYYARIKSRGQEIRRSLTTTDRDLAKRRLAKLKDDLLKIDPAKGKITLAELCDQYLRTVQHQKAKTIERKTLIVQRLKDEWPGGSDCSLGKIRPSDIQLWLAQYKFGSASRNLHLACTKDIFDMAVGDGIIASSPASNLKAVKLDKPIRKTPTIEKFKAIVANVRSQPFNADAQESANFIEFLGLAGLGQAEAGSLTWGDIDWRSERITTFRHKTKSGFAIPLYPQLRPLLEKLKGERNPPSDEHVFKIKDAKKALAASCKRLGITPYSQRAFRRLFITRAIQKGVDVKVIAEWQGHKDGGKLILGTYSHVFDSHSSRMAQLLTHETPDNVIPITAKTA